MSPRREDLVGRRFGRLTVTSFSHVTKWRAAYWNCVCDCGNPHAAASTSLNSGGVRSCGCLRENSVAAALVVNVTHGLSRSNPPEYRIWRNMLSRCRNKKLAAYKHYGGRGIAVCQRWQDSFEDFLADVGPRPSPGHSIDRFPNANGNYEPGNVRWATPDEQARNKRNNHLIEHAGVTLCEADWCERLGGVPGVVNKRLQAGWTIVDAVTRPLRVNSRNRARVMRSEPEAQP